MKELSGRDEWLLEMRPEIKDVHEAESEEELFQNKTLRPVLKFQNAALISVLKNYIKDRKKPFKAFNQKVQKQMIRDYIQNDHPFRRELQHLIVALLTEQELHFYFTHRSECNKRIIQMLIERYCNQLERLI